MLTSFRHPVCVDPSQEPAFATIIANPPFS